MKYSTFDKLAGSTMIFVILFGLACLVGWGLNVYKFSQCDFEAPYRAEVLRGVAIPFAPLGAIAGYLSIDD